MVATKPTLLITSAAYADDSICVELGRLPPSFLPLGNQRLYQHQVKSVDGMFGRVVLSLPESFVVPPKDSELLRELGIETEFVPDGLSLGNSVAYCLETIDTPAVAILHGDTLIEDINLDAVDGFTCHTADEQPYRWAVFSEAAENDVGQITENISDAGHKVLSGFFLFSDKGTLASAIKEAGGDFIQGMREYNRCHVQAPLPAGPWFDFGHFHTYYRSKTRLTTQRAFNGLDIDRVSVTKSSGDSFKMECEAGWFKSLPDDLKLFTPAFLGTGTTADGHHSYRTERLLFSSLNDMFIFGQLRRQIWESIFGECSYFLESCKSHKPDTHQSNDCSHLYLPKTLSRLKAFASATGFPVDQTGSLNGRAVPSAIEIAEYAQTFIPPLPAEQQSIMHGDFCFSNILYDSRARQIRVVDPRGYIESGKPSIYGDPRYDLGKLFHSAVGFYDLIIAGYFRLERSGNDFTFTLLLDDAITTARDAFLAHDFAGISGDDPSLMAIGIHLFLSMIPLHADKPERQLAFLANAYRLYFMLRDKTGAEA